MQKNNDIKTENLGAVIDREIAKNPHNTEILNAFRPVMLARNRVGSQIRLNSIPTVEFDPVRFSAGVPLIRQHAMFLPDDPWEDMLAAMIPAVRAGFPNLGKDLDHFQQACKNGRLDLNDYFTALPDHGGDVIDRWADDLRASPQGIALLLHQLVRIILENRAARNGVEDAEKAGWKKGYCPVCGAFPSIALIEEKIPRRWLHCSQCGHDWLFSRVICPCCENEAQQGMDFFFIEDRPQESAFTCDRCGKYLITLNRVSDLNDHDLDVSAISLTHLDVIMQGKGGSPMAACAWNTFQ